MRRVKKINSQILTREARYTEVYPESAERRKQAILGVEKVLHQVIRNIVCLNQRQARKVAADREALIESLKRQLKNGTKELVNNKGFRKYLSWPKNSARIDPA